MRRLLPEIPDRQTYIECFRQREIWRPAMAAIAERHGVSAADVRPFEDGSNIVFGLGEARVVKLIAPIWHGEFAIERLLVQRLHGHLSIRTPELLGEGEIESWPYVILDRLPGRAIGEVFDGFAPADQRRLARQIGALAAEIHALPIAGLESIRIDWAAFIEKQIADCVTAQRRRGTPESLLDGLGEFVAEVETLIPREISPVLLHADMTHEHLLIVEHNGRPEIGGFIDFADAKLGHFEYEFAAPMALILRGRPDLRREFLRGYGFAESDLDGEMSARILAYIVLHEFAELAPIAECFPGESKPATWAALREGLSAL